MVYDTNQHPHSCFMDETKYDRRRTAFDCKPHVNASDQRTFLSPLSPPTGVLTGRLPRASDFGNMRDPNDLCAPKTIQTQNPFFSSYYCALILSNIKSPKPNIFVKTPKKYKFAAFGNNNAHCKILQNRFDFASSFVIVSGIALAITQMGPARGLRGPLHGRQVPSRDALRW